MMILSLFDEGMRVRADTPRWVVPPKQSHQQQNCNYPGAVLGSAPGVFMRMTPNRRGTVLGSAPEVFVRIPPHKCTLNGAEIARERGVAVWAPFPNEPGRLALPLWVD